MSFLVAIQLLTSIPVAVKREIGPERLGRATAWFPVVGLVIGLVLAGLNWLLSIFLPQALSSAILIAALVGITGAMHLDGLADTCDGMAGYRTREERLRIMHDSRTGAFGVVGIVIVLLVKYAALSNVPPAYINAVLILTPVISRWAMVYAIYAFRYASPEGLGASYKQATHLPQFIIATLITLAVAGALIPPLFIAGFLCMAAAWAITTLAALYFRSKLGGLTGDTYGTINELAEATIFIFIVILY